MVLASRRRLSGDGAGAGTGAGATGALAVRRAQGLASLPRRVGATLKRKFWDSNELVSATAGAFESETCLSYAPHTRPKTHHPPTPNTHSASARHPGDAVRERAREHGAAPAPRLPPHGAFGLVGGRDMCALLRSPVDRPNPIPLTQPPPNTNTHPGGRVRVRPGARGHDAAALALRAPARRPHPALLPRRGGQHPVAPLRPPRTCRRGLR